MNRHPRILIVGTVPYNVKSTSRAFESYFSNWEKDNLAQVFSHTKKPCKGHCGYFYQITDQRLLKRRFKKNIEVGIAYKDNELDDVWRDNSLEVGTGVFKSAYTKKNRKTSFWHLVRKVIWAKKYWNTKKFNDWLDEFNPEAVFLSFSNDFFILEIALYIANKYDIPIISSTGDDYYFNAKFSLSPFYHIYRKMYKKLVSKVFSYAGDTIYISDKIRDKYNDFFKINGKTLYLASHLRRKEFAPINNQDPKISYFGNLSSGRNLSLIDIGEALSEINADFFVDVYSNEVSSKIIQSFNNKVGIRFNGSISYDDVLAKTHESDIIIIVEGMKKKDILNTKYSLSTKVADSLASGTFILVYGNKECGAIQYLSESNAALVVTTKEQLSEKIAYAINDVELQKDYYRQAILVSKANHVLQDSLLKFEEIVLAAIRNYKKNN